MMLPSFKFPAHWNVFFPIAEGYYPNQVYVYLDGMRQEDAISIVVIRNEHADIRERHPMYYEFAFDENGQEQRFQFNETAEMFAAIEHAFTYKAAQIETTRNGVALILTALREYTPEPHETSLYTKLNMLCESVLRK